MSYHVVKESFSISLEFLIEYKLLRLTSRYGIMPHTTQVLLWRLHSLLGKTHLCMLLVVKAQRESFDFAASFYLLH